MKILCLVSSQPGHIDFGGKGFTGLAKQLESRCHQVEWVSFGEQPERLTRLGFSVKALSAVSSLSLLPLLNVEEIHLHEQEHQCRVDALKALNFFLDKEQPDILIIDRLLTYAPLSAEQLNIAYITIGTPGGYWSFKKAGQQIHAFSVTEPVNSYKAYGELLKDALGWKRGVISSFWAKSPYFNICFMNRDFYPLNKEDGDLLISVNHHKKVCFKKKKKQLGISFGNQGEQQLLFECLKQAVGLPEEVLPIHVFVGNHKETYTKLESRYSSQQVTLYRWVDFNEHFSQLSCLVFLGGVGTIWQCIEHEVTMIITPGNIGDQYFNAERVQSQGLGIHLKEGDLDNSGVTQIILQCLENTDYQRQINMFKSQCNYTDTLISICEKIENIPHL